MIGTQLGSYQVTDRLGEGGMGVVYRARDTQLGREVAIKVLPQRFVADPDRAARFEREARVLASLNHPHVAHVYGLERDGDTRALVMELVEGPTLADRLRGGPLPLDEALAIARQIAEALEEAHEKGIVHRDLKPQNVKAPLDGPVKVLDFGLAKALDPGGALSGTDPGPTESPTLTVAGTAHGVLLGTAPYMAPEQAKGRAVDKRADVWAFGVVLHEMLTGRRLFDGETVAEVLAAVIRADVDLDALPRTVPASVRRLLARCLERNPKNRLRDIGEARIALASPATPEAPAVSRPSRPSLRIAATAALSLAALAVGFAARQALTPEAPRSAARWHLLHPEGGQFNSVEGPVQISPDGSAIAFHLARRDRESTIAVRRLDSFAWRELPGAAHGYDPFWSTDGRHVAFFGSHLFRVDAAGGQPPRALAPVTDARGGDWNASGQLIYAPHPSGALFVVDAEGGEPRAVTALDATRAEVAHVRPFFLPDGRRFVYFVRSERREHTGLAAGSLDGELKKFVAPMPFAPRFVPPAHLLLEQSGRLVAQRLDLDTLELADDPVVLAEGFEYVGRFDTVPASASQSGQLVYHPPNTEQLRQTTRFDRRGRPERTFGEPGDFNLDLSPDGRRLALARVDREQRLPFVWIHDLQRDVRVRLMADLPANGPVWSPDGREIAYAVESKTDRRIAVRPADGGPERVVWRDPLLIEPIDWSPDGRTLLVEVGYPGGGVDLVEVAADGSGAPTPLIATTFAEESGRYSPDGRYVAYVSHESGRAEVYAAPVDRPGVKWLVSRRGGLAPRWRADGRELVYVGSTAEGIGARGSDALRSDRRLHSVAVKAHAAGLEFGPPVDHGPLPSIDIELTPDGRTLYATVAVSEAYAPPPVVIERWLSLLPRR